MESEITHRCLAIINEQYSNNYISFYTWLTYSSDTEFLMVYETVYKKYNVCITDIEIFNAINLSNAVWSFYEVERDISKLNNFIKKFIQCQFKEIK